MLKMRSAEFGMRSKVKLALCGALFLIGGRVHELLQRRFVADGNFNHPAGVVGVAGQRLELLCEVAVYGDDFAIDRTIEIADGFDRFDLAKWLAGCHLRADLGQDHVYEVRELLQSERG